MPPGRPRNPGEAADALRAAVDQTFQATFGRLATGDDVRELRERLEKLEQRIEALEKKEPQNRKRG